MFFDILRTTASPVGSECATSDGRDRLKHGRVGLELGPARLERGRDWLKRGDFPGNYGHG